MNASASAADRAEPDLVAAWLRGRSIARRLPAPVADRGGWRVETGSEAELRRHVFAAPSSAVAALAQAIDRPRIFLKCCVDDATLRALLPPVWQLRDPSWVMTGPAHMAARRLPSGYTMEIEHAGGAIAARITAADGTLAASGHAAEMDGAFVYDRIVTAAGHQRRGLGGVVMTRLAAERRSAGSRPVLVATDQGRALYLALGWQIHAPYATAVIPDPPA